MCVCGISKPNQTKLNQRDQIKLNRSKPNTIYFVCLFKPSVQTQADSGWLNPVELAQRTLPSVDPRGPGLRAAGPPAHHPDHAVPPGPLLRHQRPAGVALAGVHTAQQAAQYTQAGDRMLYLAIFLSFRIEAVGYLPAQSMRGVIWLAE